MFPTIPIVTTFTPSKLQSDAMDFLQSGANRFSNPIMIKMGDFKNSLITPGGFPLQDISNLQNTISNAIPENVPGADTINAQIEQYMGAELFVLAQKLNTYKLTDLMDVSPHIESVLEPVLSIQTSRIVNDLPKVMSMTNAYNELMASYAPRDPSTGHQTVSTCDIMEDLMGSLGGAADKLTGDMTDAVTRAAGLLNGASAAVKAELNTTMGDVSRVVQQIQTDIAAWVAGGSNMFTPPDLTLFNDLKTKLAGVAQSVDNFMVSAASAANKTVSDLTVELGAAITDMKTHIVDVTTMIQNELAELNKVITYVTNASIVSMCSNLSPCGKAVVGSLAEAAGATKLVDLVRA